MKCTNCGAEILDNARFCAECGATIEPVAEETVAEVAAEAPVQEAPAEPIVEEVQAAEPVVTPVTPVETASSADSARDTFISEGKSKKKNKLIGIVAIVLVVAILIGVFSVLFGGKKGKEAPFTYVADGALKIVTKLGNKEAEVFEVTDDYGGDYEYSENFKYIVYAEDYDDGEFDLYFRQVGKEKKEPVKLAKGVSSLIAVVGNVDKVVYTKNGDIYSCDDKGESEKIIGDAAFCSITEDNKYLLAKEYNDAEYDEDKDQSIENWDLHLIELKSNESTKIAEKVVEHDYDDNLEKFYTVDLKGKAEVYDRKGKGKEIAKDVESINLIDETLFYTVEGDAYKLYDFVSDSYKDADSKLVEPVAPNWYDDYCPDSSDPKYQKEEQGVYLTWTVTDWDLYNADKEIAQEKYDADYEKYEEARDKYWEAESRISLRERLKEAELNATYKLYSYNGSKSTLVTEYATTEYIDTIYNLGIVPEDEEVVYKYGTISAYEKNPTELEKIKIDEIDSVYSLESKIREEITSVKCIVGKDKFVPCAIEDVEVRSIRYDEKGGRFVIVASDIEKKSTESTDSSYESDGAEIDYNVTDIYTLAEKQKTFDKAEMLYEDIGCYFYAEDIIAVEDVDMDDGTRVGTIKVDKFTADDVWTRYIYVNKEDPKEFYYMSDIDTETYEGTLYLRKGKKSEKIAEDIYGDFGSISYIDGKYLVITDVDEDDRTGTLTCITKNGKSYEIESDVSTVSSVGIATVYSYGEVY